MLGKCNVPIPDDIAALFAPQIKTRGHQYHRDGLVQIISVSEDHAVALVTGSEVYHVLVQWGEPDGLDLDCSCPYFQDTGPCKHAWATLLELDEQEIIPELDAADDRRVHSPAALPSRSSGLAPVTPKQDWKRIIALGRQSSTEVRTSDNHAWPTNRRINYIVDLPATISAGHGVVVELATEALNRHGEWNPPKRFGLSQQQWHSAPDLMDRHIAQMLVGARLEQSYYYGAYGGPLARRYMIPESAFDTTLRCMCDTGRCRVRVSENEERPAVLAWDAGEPWDLQLEILPDVEGDVDGGDYVLSGILRRTDERMPVENATLLQRGGVMIADRTVACYRDFGAFELAHALRSSGPLRIPAADALALLTALYSLPHIPPLALSPELAVEEVHAQPVPRLAITQPRSANWGPQALPCELSFDYGGVVVSAAHPQDAFFQPSERRLVHRDRAAESRAWEHVAALGVRQEIAYYGHGKDLRLTPAKLDSVVQTLAADGWQVELRGRRVHSAGVLRAEVRSGIDWFDLEANVDFGDSTATLPELLAALERGERMVTLGDGSLGLLPAEMIQRLRSLAGLGTAADGKVRFARTQLAMLDAMLAAMPGARVGVDEVFEQARSAFARFESIGPVDAPDGFAGELRPYQREGLGWLDFLRQFGFGGCLADDMGLGKTVQVLASLEARRQDGAGPSVVVVPKSLVFNWRQEAERFAPAMRVLEHTGTQRSREPLDPRSFDLVLTTYGVLRRDAAMLREIPFDYAILDEAQAIKNPATANAKAARLLRARHRLVLTGTPVENRLSDLWSLFEFLNPGMLGAARVFRAVGLGDSERDRAGRAVLTRALRPFILRRTKQQVASDLPERAEQTLYVELGSRQRKLYNQLRDHYRASLLDRVARGGMQRARMHVLEALLRLRQAACHPGLIDNARADESSSKLDLLIPRLAELAGEQHKVLVFSQFTSLLSIVRKRLDSEGIVYEYLDGRTRDRQARVERFQGDSECPVFLISLKAGGVGLNLTAADYVFLLDPWWNPAVEAQAIDRAHRIGQTRRVLATRIIARDTVEEKVMTLQRTKRELADAIINSDNSIIATLRREDLEQLLG